MKILIFAWSTSLKIDISLLTTGFRPTQMHDTMKVDAIPSGVVRMKRNAMSISKRNGNPMLNLSPLLPAEL
jgi:hypothetical protein